MSKYIDAEEITPIMAEYVADVFSRKEHLDNISYSYCMEIADAFRRYAERAEPEQPASEEQAAILKLCKTVRRYAAPAKDDDYCSRSELLRAVADAEKIAHRMK